MWQAPSQRTRAVANAKKKQRDASSRRLHIKRVKAELRVVVQGNTAPEVNEVRVVLNDMTERGMGLYSQNPIGVGREVAVTLESPRQIYLRGHVTWCQEFDAESRILAQNPFSYRVGVKFIFQSPEEEEAVKNFFEELISQHLQVEAA